MLQVVFIGIIGGGVPLLLAGLVAASVCIIKKKEVKVFAKKLCM